MDDDIEILDIFEEKKEIAPVQKVSRVENKSNDEEKPKKTKKKVKKTAFQALFCLISALFILGCIVFYGYRFIKYYRIYNPKVESGDGSILLAKDIVGKTEFDDEAINGLFSSSGNYIYKGNVDNNYIKFNNMLWRIVRINADNSLDIILDDYITLLPWNKEADEFKKSEIYKYLNNEFLSNLNIDLLAKTSFCEDGIDDLTKITCTKQDSDSYVKLLDVSNFLNSVKNSKSYLVSDEEIFWLSDYGNEKAWHTNGTSVSQSDANTFYEIRPVVRLKSTTFYSKGEGSKSSPFEIDKEGSLQLGSRVILGEDKWIVYDTTNDIKLIKEDLIEKQLDFDKENNSYNNSSLMEYLNDTYLNSLSYKDQLVETTWYTGTYKNSISDIKSDSIKKKVGIPNLLDLKFDSSIKAYFTSTGKEDRILVYENPLRPSKVTTYRSIRPCIAISKETASKLVYKDGFYKVGE